ncbi:MULTISPECIES: MerR family DNA-binding transcriptional regulator [unclassified Bartonella]|uniref:MerR family DNA-binding transcriptional regulator n=1 Tax=unclassified Bartonella TaxID=2645622 RepID=UPI0035D12C43
MDRFIGIGKAAQVLGVSISTLRRWECEDKIISEHTAGGHRRYDLSRLRPELFIRENYHKEKPLLMRVYRAMIKKTI